MIEALAESDFKIYTNYEYNYNVIYPILRYHNVIVDIFTLTFLLSSSFFFSKNQKSSKIRGKM